MNIRKLLLVMLMIFSVLSISFIHSAPSQEKEAPLIVYPGRDGIATVTGYNVFITPSCIVEATVNYSDVVHLQCPEGYTDLIGIANLTLNPNQIYEFQIFVAYQNKTILLHHYRNGMIIQKNTFTLLSGTEAIMGISIMSTVNQVGPIDTIKYEIVCSYGARDIAIISVTSSKTEVYAGEIVNLTVVLKNAGTEIETFSVTAYYGCGGIVIETKSVTNLAPATGTTLVFTWDTASVRPFARVPYTIWAVASVLPGEMNTTNNIYVAEQIKVKAKGDINGDGIIDIYDAISLAMAFGSTSGDRNWNPQCDINRDEIVDIFDAIMLAINFGHEDEIIQVVDHVVVWNGRTFHVATESNSTVYDLAFSQPNKEISFNVTGLCGTTSFCFVTIPINLLGPLYTVFIDGAKVPSMIWEGNLTHVKLYFTYSFPPATRKVQIIGETVVSGSSISSKESFNGLSFLVLPNDEIKKKIFCSLS